MPTVHLALPLPKAYEHNAKDDFSFFTCTTDTAVLPERLDSYLNDLSDFLKRTKLIQRHPDHFFDFALSNSGSDSNNTDGAVDADAEINYTQSLCYSFSQLGDQLDLRHLIECGPPAECGDLLRFYEETTKLQLSRRRSSNAVALTMQRREDLPQNSLHDAMQNDTAENERRERIMELVLSHGMSPKKKHEVSLMCSAIMSLLSLCRTSGNPIETVINIGEGKGYVSRALSLVYGLQVVGLDCNPAHKEKALGRIESLLESSCNAGHMFKGNNKRYATPLNLLYEPRGHVASIQCRVGASLDWEKLLKGYVRTSECAIEDEGLMEDSEDVYVRIDQPVNDVADSKMKCRACGRILRRSLSALVKHANQHADQREVYQNLRVSFETVSAWRSELPSEKLSKLLVDTFFEPLSKKREVADRSPLQPLYIPRGFRIRVRVSVKQFPFLSCDGEQNVTILGFDEASNMHKVIFDEKQYRTSLILVTLPNEKGDDAASHALESNRMGLVVHTYEPFKTRKPIVNVPHVDNIMLMGLHTCGDLGSSICRLFSSSEARGLILVSCCWHALTVNGFPLSNAIKQRGFSINQISLLLATQPFDMWRNVDVTGHRGSAKLLFYRSLTKHIWGLWKTKWEDAKVSGCCCEFAPLPHLEPAFLRHAARQKDTLTFSTFLRGVLAYYIFEDEMHKTAYTWDNQVCVLCRHKQEVFFKDLLSREDERLVENETSCLFGPFLGLTVLRMWMCHTVESLLLLDRLLYLYESSPSSFSETMISLVPLFDGSLSPRLYGICVRRLH